VLLEGLFSEHSCKVRTFFKVRSKTRTPHTSAWSIVEGRVPRIRDAEVPQNSTRFWRTSDSGTWTYYSA
jgi:hypothetical protein